MLVEPIKHLLSFRMTERKFACRQPYHLLQRFSHRWARPLALGQDYLHDLLVERFLLGHLQRLSSTHIDVYFIQYAESKGSTIINFIP